MAGRIAPPGSSPWASWQVRCSGRGDAASAESSSAADLHAYVDATRAVATTSMADAFLRGMLVHLDGALED